MGGVLVALGVVAQVHADDENRRHVKMSMKLWALRRPMRIVSSAVTFTVVASRRSLTAASEAAAATAEKVRDNATFVGFAGGPAPPPFAARAELARHTDNAALRAHAMTSCNSKAAAPISGRRGAPSRSCALAGPRYSPEPGQRSDEGRGPRSASAVATLAGHGCLSQ